MTNTIKVSIIVPIYNVEAYIVRCLQSVMAQTYDGPMECLLVDDCGADNSMIVAEQMVSGYKGAINFKIIHHEHNRGLSAARNTGTDAATGDYVFYLDSDDAITPDCLGLMVAEVKKHPEVEMVLGDYEIVSNNGTKQESNCLKGRYYVEDNAWVRYHFFKEGDCLKETAWNSLIKRAFIYQNGLRFKEGVIHEDEHWSFYLYRNVNSLSVVGDVTYSYYSSPNSIMNTNTKLKRASNLFIVLNDIMKDFDNPIRSLQVFRYLVHFKSSVLPYLPKRQTKEMYFKFLGELVSIGQYKIAFYWLINWFRNFRRSWLYYNMIPEAYIRESEKSC